MTSLLQMRMDDSLAACAAQREVNAQLMAAKTQIEWQLLEAKAQPMSMSKASSCLLHVYQTLAEILC